MKLEKNDIIFFHGDSVTDANRDRADKYSLSGYSKIIAGKLNGYGIECYSRGASGARTTELLPRLDKQLEEIRPTVFSILIGINDVWRKFDANMPTSDKQFEENYMQLLESAAKFTKKIVVLEPFLLPIDPLKAIFRTAWILKFKSYANVRLNLRQFISR